MRKEILIGFLVGLLATIIGFYMYVEFVLNGSFQESLAIINQKKSLRSNFKYCGYSKSISFFRLY